MLNVTGTSTVSRVRAQLLEELGNERWQSGERLPAERQLAADLGVSRTTLREALALLARSGHVIRRAGRGGGTFVAPTKVDRDLRVMTGLPGHLRRQGHESTSTVLSANLVAADLKVADALGIGPESLVNEIVRVRFSDGVPISLECSRFPTDRFPDFLRHPLGGSLYEIAEFEYGIKPTRAKEVIEPVMPSEQEARLLDIDVSQPVLSIERVAYDAAGAPIEYGEDLFRGDRTRVVALVGIDDVTSPAGRTDVN